LLEKSRVVHQQALERNYHFFYQLISAASGDSELSTMLHLNDVGPNSDDKDACDTEDFWYTNQSSVHSIEGMNDTEDYHEVRTAMETLGMSISDQHEVCKATASILHLGNINFSEAETSGDVAAKIKDVSVVKTVCLLLGLDENELERCLTSKNIGARSIITCRYTPLQATDARDALSKKLYANLFDWLIKFINVSLAGSSKENAQKMTFIAVLDIFGFEAFEHNSFEQLCINYCNEKLQFHFNNHIFLMEQQEYAKEGISVSNIQFEDNQSTLDLLELGFTGIFSMIDEEINVPRGSDEQLLSKMFQKHLQHAHFERPKAKNHPSSVMDSLFVVVHYAGPVGYNVGGFLEKNKDQLSEDLEQMCKVSKSSFVRTLFGVRNNYLLLLFVDMLLEDCRSYFILF
jgi:myosin heavy subunit